MEGLAPGARSLTAELGGGLGSWLARVGWGCMHAQVPRRMIGTDAFQETPIVEVTRQITKHNYLVMDVRDLPRVVKEVRARMGFVHGFRVHV